MFVPRAYMRPAYPAEKSPKSSSSRRSARTSSTKKPLSEIKSATLPARPKSVPLQTKSHTQASAGSYGSNVASEPKISTKPSPKAPPTSQPMSIPTKKRSSSSINTMHSRKESKEPKEFKDSKENKEAKLSKKLSKDHSALPASVAALLATTAIPPRKHLSIKSRSGIPKRVSIEHLREEWKNSISAASSFGKGSPLDFLLEPSESETQSLHLGDDECENVSTIPSRSVSSDSIMSTPSLEPDELSAVALSPSFGSLPLTPNSLRRTSRSDRKVSSPPSETCPNHPLLELPPPPKTYSRPIAIVPKPQPPKSVPAPPRSTFKSNLTASLLAIRSAAKAFSNFTAPSLPSDDFLTRSLFSSQKNYASEMMPRNFKGVPDPALRRYLNPAPTPPLPNDFHRILTDVTWWTEEGEQGEGKKKPMIQLQTYTRRGKRTQSPHPRQDKNEEQDFVEGALLPRAREPRENSEFLRVVCLELQMRKAGKLSPTGPLRARVYLEPRKYVTPSSGRTCLNGIPERWIGLSADEL